jgi:hypothetical protein
MLGSLVRMKNEPYEVLGMIVEVIPRKLGDEYYRIEWFCDLCDVTYADKWNLEIVC